MSPLLLCLHLLMISGSRMNDLRFSNDKSILHKLFIHKNEEKFQIPILPNLKETSFFDQTFLIFCLELAREISLTSLGSNQTFFFPQFMTEAANLITFMKLTKLEWSEFSHYLPLLKFQWHLKQITNKDETIWKDNKLIKNHY